MKLHASRNYIYSRNFTNHSTASPYKDRASIHRPALCFIFPQYIIGHKFISCHLNATFFTGMLCASPLRNIRFFAQFFFFSIHRSLL